MAQLLSWPYRLPLPNQSDTPVWHATSLPCSTFWGIYSGLFHWKPFPESRLQFERTRMWRSSLLSCICLQLSNYLWSFLNSELQKLNKAPLFESLPFRMSPPSFVLKSKISLFVCHTSLSFLSKNTSLSVTILASPSLSFYCADCLKVIDNASDCGLNNHLKGISVSLSPAIHHAYHYKFTAILYIFDERKIRICVEDCSCWFSTLVMWQSLVAPQVDAEKHSNDRLQEENDRSQEFFFFCLFLLCEQSSQKFILKSDIPWENERPQISVWLFSCPQDFPVRSTFPSDVLSLLWPQYLLESNPNPHCSDCWPRDGTENFRIKDSFTCSGQLEKKNTGSAQRGLIILKLCKGSYHCNMIMNLE